MTAILHSLETYIYFILASFLASLRVYYKLDKRYWYLQLFPPFLLVAACAEVAGSYLAYIDKNNVALYNFFSTAEFCFYLVFLSLAIGNRKARRMIWFITVAYAVLAVTNIIFIQKINVFHTTTHALGCLLVAAVCCYYFVELFRLPKPDRLQYNPVFWICTGLLFFYSCGFAVFGFVNVWQTYKIFTNNYFLIIELLNIFLYSLFTIGFLCLRTRNSTS